MMISVLATKCRWCGEDVGKPKDETRELSITDLGGETIYHRAPSGSVMDALESFRVEESSENMSVEKDDDLEQITTQKRIESADDIAPTDADGMPVLNEMSQQLASMSGSDSISTRSTPKRRPATWRDNIVPVSAAILGIAAVSIAGVFGWGKYQDYVEEKNRPPEIIYVNKAPGLLAQGRSMEALQAAANALGENPTEENKAIAQSAVDAVREDVNKILNADIWSINEISGAAGLAEKAEEIYHSPDTARLKTDTAAENSLYRMVLTEVDAKKGEAIFTLIKTNNPSQTVHQGDFLEERFLVKKISTRSVIVEDSLRKNAFGNQRKVVFEIRRPAHP